MKELRFPLLQELRLHGDREGCTPHTQDMHFRFAESNQLRIFRDKATSLDYAFTLYFGQLKELDIQLGPDNYPEIFQLAHSLEILRLHLIEGRRGWPNSSVRLPFLLQDLHYLLIEALPGDVSHCLQSIITPRLNTLIVNVMSENEDSSWLHSIVDFQMRSACRLTSLTLENGYVASEEELVANLEVLPMIERLSIDALLNFTLSDSAVFKLNPTEQGEGVQRFLPNLKKFYYRGHIEFHPNSLLEMVRERRHSYPGSSSAVLQKIDILFWNREWGHSGGSDPNVLREFYLQLASLSCSELTLSIAWEDIEDVEDVEGVDDD